MKTKELIAVQLSKKELFFMFKEIAFDCLKSDVPNIATAVQENEISMILKRTETIFKIVFTCQVRSEVGSAISKVLDITLVFPEAVVTEKIIDTILEKKNIIKAVHLNTPITDLRYYSGDLLVNHDEEAISFNFSLHYDDPSDYQ